MEFIVIHWASNGSNNISGLIGVELEGTPTKISVRNIWLRKIN